MKNVFGMIKGTEKTLGQDFVVHELSGEVKRKFDELNAERERTEKAILPPWLVILSSVCFLVAVVCVWIYLEILEDLSFSETVENNTIWILVGAVIFLLAAVGLFVFLRIRKNRAMASPAYRHLEERWEKMTRECLEFLGVPQDAAETFVVAGLARNGKANKLFRATTNVPMKVYAFRDGDALCLADLGSVYRIPLSEIIRIALVKKRIAFIESDIVKFGKEERKQYKIQTNKQLVSLKPYYRAEIFHGMEEFEILLLPHTADAIVALTGKTPE